MHFANLPMSSSLFPAPETLSAENADCTLTVTLAFTRPEALELHYQVQSHSAHALYLLNQLWKDIDPQNRVLVPPNRVNIEVQPGRVSVKQAIPEVPYGLLVEALYMPFMVRVAPRAAYTYTVELPVPLLPYTAYESDSAVGPLLTCALHVGLGYIVGLPHVEQALRQAVATTGDVLFASPPFQAKYQSIIEVGPFQELVLAASQLNPYPPKPVSTDKWTPWG
jgi:hypothetical protein